MRHCLLHIALFTIALFALSCQKTPQSKSVSGITLTPSTLSLEVGLSAEIEVSIIPFDADNKSVVWSTSNSAVATISNKRVTAISPGTAIITAESVDGGLTASCIVTVIPAPIRVTSISLSKEEVSLYVGSSETIIANISPYDATNKTVKWSSSDLSVAKVDSGIIQAVSDGTATITAVAEDYSADCIVHVYKSPAECLSFKVFESGDIIWKVYHKSMFEIKTVEFSLDDGNHWTTINSSSEGTKLSVKKGDIILWRGTNTEYGNEALGWWTSFETANGAKFFASGPVTSLLHEDYRDHLKPDAFYRLFYNCEGLYTEKSTPIVLPSSKLETSCYRELFYGCINFAYAPDLPALSAPEACYYAMFQNCIKLEIAPSLPATQLDSWCYGYMFAGCESLIAMPELPALELASYCYCSMFKDCTNLRIASDLPATTLAPICYQSMFLGCRSLTTAPMLPAPILVDGCYQQMFMDCTSLNHIVCLATDISASGCTDNYVYNVSPTGTFVKSPSMQSWKRGYKGIPYGWRISDYSVTSNVQ